MEDSVHIIQLYDFEGTANSIKSNSKIIIGVKSIYSPRLWQTLIPQANSKWVYHLTVRSCKD